jgi:para-nitrobenzyl esterase
MRMAILRSTAVALVALSLALVFADSAPVRRSFADLGRGPELAGTAWQWVRFQSSDDTVATPDDPELFTIAFFEDGAAAIRADCNRGQGTWSATSSHQLRFGPLALTRATCAPGSMHDRFVRDLDSIRSYVRRDGKLYLALLADGGIYEFAPAPFPATR